MVAAKMVSKGDPKAKGLYQEQKSSALVEWLGGLLTIFGPFLFIHYLLRFLLWLSLAKVKKVFLFCFSKKDLFVSFNFYN